MINIQSDSIVRQTNKVHLLSYTMMNNEHIFITSYFSLPYHQGINIQGCKNEGNDHQLKMFLIVKQILLLSTMGNV